MSLEDGFGEISGAAFRKRAISELRVLNEAYDYEQPSSFSRGMRIDLNGLVVLLISGTASIDETGATVHVGDFRAQCRRMFSNITALLAAEGATWHDVVRTTFYLRDIDRDYSEFNEERTAFYKQQGLNPLPASTGVQARLGPPGTAGGRRSHRSVPQPQVGAGHTRPPSRRAIRQKRGGFAPPPSGHANVT